jgi:glutamine amidotransferase
MFMHNGRIGGWDGLRRKVESAIPDDLFRHRQGTTDSEAIFLLMLANGLEEDPLEAYRRTMGFIGGVMREAGEPEPLRVTAAVSDGEHIFAIRHASDAAPETLYVRKRKRVDGTLLVSEPLDDGRDDWELIPPQSFVALTRNDLAIQPFRPDVAS